jgi:hypothetical protein
MPKITQYTQENTPTAVNQGRQAQAADMGGNQAGIMAQAQASQDIANAAGQAADVVTGIETKRRNRIDTINVARMADNFYNDAFSEYNRALAEDDIIDPATTEKFNNTIRSKSAAVLAGFQGSEEARARLEMEITNQASQFTRQMTSTGIGAQRQFIMKKAGDKISTLTSQISENPASYNEVMQQGDMIVKELAPALYAEDEMALSKAMKEQISVSALNSYIDRGMYDDANSLIDANPAILENMQPETQRRVLGEIAQAQKERNKVIDEAQKKKALLEWGQGVTGQKADPMAALNFIMGYDLKKSDEQVLTDVANIYGMKPEQLPPEVTLKVKYPDLKLFDAETDQNKDRGEGGRLTAQGISKNLAPIVSSVEDIRNRKLMLDTAIEQGKAGNLAATQAAVIAFRKMLDPTSAVMQSEFETQKDAASISDRIDLMFSPGKTITASQLDELKQFTDQFAQDLIKSKKKKADFLLTDADTRLMRRIDVGLPNEVYKDLFGTDVVGEKTDTPAPAGLDALSEDDINRMLEEMRGAKK